MRHDRDTALDQCLAWVRAGKDVESCLERYAEYADELRPLLMLAVDVGRVTIPAVPAMARAAGQRRMLAAYTKREEQRAQTHPVVRHAARLSWALVPGRPGSLKPAWPAVVAVLFVLLVGIGGVTVSASAGSLPGDALYPVKLASQRLQLALTLNPVAHDLLVERYDTLRRRDVQAVLKGGTRTTVEFQGTLQRMEESLWIVSGLPVALNETTTIVGTPYLGAAVRVRGQLPGDGQLMAIWVSVESEVGPLPTPTSEATHTLPPASTPTRAETPAPTRTVELTPPAEETGAPASGDAQAQTETPEIDTPEPTAMPEPLESPTSTGAPEQSESRDDGEMPDPTETPEPADGPEPATSPEPSETTGPSETPESRETPEEDEVPERTGTPVDDDGPEDGETPEPGTTPDD